MKITRKITQPKKPRKPRTKKRIIQNNPNNTSIDINSFNNPQTFTYLDYNRNQNMIEVIRKHYEQMIRLYGVDLTYFRKFNTFFMEGEQNKSNLTYGEDTTAEYYASGMVRAFLDINTYNWLFNSMGYETQENINLYIGIEDFRTRFNTIIGKLSTEMFYVPVEGNTIYNQLSGVIDCPEFYADIYGRFDDNLQAINIYPVIKNRPINSSLYKSVQHLTTLYPLTGVLNGKLIMDDEYSTKCSGIISGKLTYHVNQNIENSPAWKLAPQVGDFFNLKIGQIEQEYQITQIFDRILQNNGGINPLLGKYIFQVQATRRSPSHQEFTDTVSPQNQKSQEEILNDLFHTSNLETTQSQEPILSDTVKEDQNCKHTKANEQSNQIADGIYNYKYEQDQDDYVYGGYSHHIHPKKKN